MAPNKKSPAKKAPRKTASTRNCKTTISKKKSDQEKPVLRSHKTITPRDNGSLTVSNSSPMVNDAHINRSSVETTTSMDVNTGQSDRSSADIDSSDDSAPGDPCVCPGHDKNSNMQACMEIAQNERREEYGFVLELLMSMLLHDRGRSVIKEEFRDEMISTITRAEMFVHPELQGE